MIEFRLKLRNSQLHDVLSAEGLRAAPAGTLQKTLQQAGFSTRIVNALRGAKVYTMEDLTNMHHSKLCFVRNLGVTSIQEIDSKLQQLGLTMKD